jgi:hypothetical protein
MAINGTYTKQITCDSSTLVDKEGYGVKAASGLVALSGASTLMIGVVRVGAAAGKLVDVALSGDIAPVKLAGTVYKGDKLLVDSSSTFSATTPTDGDIVAAIALEDGVSGDLIDAIILPAMRYEAG